MTIQIKQGHCVDVLGEMEPGSVHALCTSPPYFRARRYNCPPQVWPDPEGTPPCADGAHEWEGAAATPARFRNGQGSALPRITHPKGKPHELNPDGGVLCRRCNAYLGELGWEPTVGRFVAHLVQVFRAAKRVLRDDGQLWINIAGGYANEAGGQNGGRNGQGASTLFLSAASPPGGPGLAALHQQNRPATRISAKAVEANRQAGRTDKTGGLPPLNWIDVPGLLGAAMQADGWIWRSYVHLVKRSPLPESVQGWRWERCRVRVAAGEPVNATKQGASEDRRQAGFNERYFEGNGAAQWADCPGCPKCDKTDNLVLHRGAWRPTRATEALLLFVKGDRYWSDAEAVRVSSTDGRLARWGNGGDRRTGTKHAAERDDGTKPTTPFVGVPAPGRNAWDWMDWPSREAGLGSIRSVKRVPVAPDAVDGDTVRIPSPDCPVHGGRRVATSARDGRGAAQSPHTHGSGGHPVLIPGAGSPAMLPLIETDDLGWPDAGRAGSRVASAHSTPSDRTAPAGSNSPADTSSAGTLFRIGDRPALPGAVETRPGIPESSTFVPAGRGGLSAETPSRIAGIPGPETGGGVAPPTGAGLPPGTPTNSTPGGCVPGGRDSASSAQTPDHNTGTATSGCTCSYYRESIQDSNHFAAYPPDLAAFCIKAAVPERCCPVCGAGYARVIERGLPNPERPQAARALELARQKGLTAGHLAAIRATGVTDTGKAQVTQNGAGRNTAEVQRLAAEAKQALGGYFREFLWGENLTTSWRPTCACTSAGPPVAGTVLDPFSGAGSTLIAADRLGRNGIGIDLNDSYVDLSETRIDVARAEATGGGMDRNGRVWEVLALPLAAD